MSAELRSIYSAREPYTWLSGRQKLTPESCNESLIW
jgi:hypothetical protein